MCAVAVQTKTPMPVMKQGTADVAKKPKPSDINVSSGLIGSQLGKKEFEAAAVAIIRLAQKKDKWRPFTLGAYLHHRFGTSQKNWEEQEVAKERQILDQLVAMEILDQDKDANYTVSETFFGSLKDFIGR
jgi:hypothetical protein